MSALEDAQRAEAEARAAYNSAVEHRFSELLSEADTTECDAFVDRCWVRLAEAVRRTERVRAEALFAAAERMNGVIWRLDLVGFDYTAEYEDAAKQLRSTLAVYRESQALT